MLTTDSTAASPDAPQSLRELVDRLESAGKLRRITAEVDHSWEPACIAKWMFQALPDDQRFALLFERVRGSAIPLLTGAFGAGVEAYALAIGTHPEGINERIRSALGGAQTPITVDEGVCQEVSRRCDLGLLPIPTWTPGKDAGPYLTTTVITKNVETGQQNYGVYRTQVLDANHVVVNLSPNRQGARNVRSYTDRGLRAPIAWIIGAEPAVHIASVANLSYGTDEMCFAGGLLGRPVELVGAAEVDLQVPARSEIIIEGTIGTETTLEGPFGEFAGFMGPVDERPIATIAAITSRRDPMYCGLTSQMPPSESTVMQSNTNAGLLYRLLRDDFGETGVADVFVDLTFGGVLAHVIVAMKPQIPGHAQRIGRLIASATPFKRVTLVDEDIDVRDPSHVEWAMNARFDPANDVIIVDNVFYSIHMDPSVRANNTGFEKGSKMIIDATQKIDAGSFSLPDKSYMDRALARWYELGLPEFSIPKRARLRIDRA